MVGKIDEPHGVANLNAELYRLTRVDLEVVGRGALRGVRGKIGQGGLGVRSGYRVGYVRDEAILRYPHEIKRESHFIHPEGGYPAPLEDE